MKDNPVTAAMQAYLRSHPHREGEVEEAFAKFDPDAEDSEPVLSGGMPAAPDEEGYGQREALTGSEQLSIGRAARDEAMRRVDAAADPAWKERCWAAIRELCERGEAFTADDIWIEVGETPGEPRALGPLMRRAVDQGMVVRAGERQSKLAHRHARPLAVWRPL